MLCKMDNCVKIQTRPARLFLYPKIQDLDLIGLRPTMANGDVLTPQAQIGQQHQERQDKADCFTM